MRLIADGVVDREGVEGLASRLGYSPRHLNRLLVAELGAGPLALARARRAHNARVLLETTDWRTVDVAFAAGFASVRQFNDTLQEVYAATPTQLRGQRAGGAAGTRGEPAHPTGANDVREGEAVVGVDVRIPVRLPFDAERMAQFLAFHLVPGIEAAGDGWYARSLRLPHGYGVVRLDLSEAAETGVVHGPADGDRPPRRRLGDRALPTAARRGLRPRRRGRGAEGRPRAGRLAAAPSRAPRARTRRR